MKPGYLTTEFWLTVIVGVLTNLGTINVPEKFKPLVTLGLVVGYAISRGLAKYEGQDGPSFPPLVEPVDPVAVEKADQAAAPKPVRSRSRKAS